MNTTRPTSWFTFPPASRAGLDVCPVAGMARAGYRFGPVSPMSA